MESGLDINRQNLLRNPKVFCRRSLTQNRSTEKQKVASISAKKQKKAGGKQKVEATATKGSRKQAGKKAESRSKKLEKLSKESQTKSKGIYLGQWGKR